MRPPRASQAALPDTPPGRTLRHQPLDLPGSEPARDQPASRGTQRKWRRGLFGARQQAHLHHRRRLHPQPGCQDDRRERRSRRSGRKGSRAYVEIGSRSGFYASTELGTEDDKGMHRPHFPWLISLSGEGLGRHRRWVGAFQAYPPR